ncbi:twin-arginine translocase TatA/TatE family subunit [Leucobacter sp. wl10]|uniref:twin-arginine translocase TatA/TatE family subunit n=1 Tax=Leucobacter sp. wl10 TaxID=2304677 RepID=UPI000E5AA8CE|nr:twin-arginine translocase TatA/TatE family subunit [Leucobacter sp. wl10]RGE23764.1 translocase [Leucobacter sp. wl10]
MFGLTIDKILVIMVIAMFVIGPERLPVYAKKLGELVRSFKRMADGAKDRLKDEMGPEFEDVDWRQLDPRQYDPRRIIRDALVEDEREARMAARRSRAADLSAGRAETAEAGAAVPGPDPGASAAAERDPVPSPKPYFDDEAT